MEDEEETPRKRFAEKAIKQLESLMHLLAALAGPLPAEVSMVLERYMYHFFFMGQQSMQQIIRDLSRKNAECEDVMHGLMDEIERLRFELRSKSNGHS